MNSFYLDPISSATLWVNTSKNSLSFIIREYVRIVCASSWKHNLIYRLLFTICSLLSVVCKSILGSDVWCCWCCLSCALHQHQLKTKLETYWITFFAIIENNCLVCWGRDLMEICEINENITRKLNLNLWHDWSFIHSFKINGKPLEYCILLFKCANNVCINILFIFPLLSSHIDLNYNWNCNYLFEKNTSRSLKCSYKVNKLLNFEESNDLAVETLTNCCKCNSRHKTLNGNKKIIQNIFYVSELQWDIFLKSIYIWCFNLPLSS